MNGRDGRHDSGDFDDADWLLSQLGNGRRPDLEGRTTPPQPVAPEPFAPPAPAEPVSPPPGDRARRRSEESLDWFSLAEPAGETDAVTRALPVVSYRDQVRAFTETSELGPREKALIKGASLRRLLEWPAKTT